MTQSPNLKQLHIYSEECGAVWLELLALNLIHLPELTTLILNCWDDGQMSCPCEIDDVVVYIVKGIIKLRTLILGPGVQPTLTGLRRIIKRSNLHTIDAYLCASIDSSESTIAELIKMTSGSCVKILRTKIPVLSRTIEETLQNFLKTAYSNENVAEGIWESENDFVIKSTIVNDLTLFRIRKVELTRPINSLKQLTNKFSCKVDSTKCKCEIPQLCDSEGPSFTCGGCARPPEVLKCRPQRCVNEDKGCQGLTHKCNNRSSCSFKGLKSRLVKCMADCIDLDNLGKKLEIPGKALWLSWNDTELQKHFSQFASHKASRRSSRMCHTDTHWILFLSAD